MQISDKEHRGPGRQLTGSKPRTVIAVRDLSVVYGSTVGLENISLSISASEHIAITGPSGSGKTTLLRAIAKKVAPNVGTVTCHRRTATIYQDLRLVPQCTALSNVLHGSVGRHCALRTALVFPKEERERATKLLKRVGLGAKLNQPVWSLSGGEQQRVAIARALMQEPEVILADEPVAALDDVNAHAILKLLREVADERGINVVAVLHSGRLADKYFDRIVRLNDGELESDEVTDSQWSHLQDSKQGQEGQAAASEFRSTQPQAGESSLKWFGLIAALAAVYAWSLSGLNISERQLEGMGSGLLTFLGELFPTSTQELSEIPWQTLLAALVETVQMAFVGTVLGVLFSFPLAALAARNTGPRVVRHGVRFLLNAIRTVPSLIWALLFVAAVGLGSVAGILALVAYSVGYLSKFFYEAFEGVDPGPPEALREIGASGLQRFFHAVWPAAMPAFLSSSMFMLEYNVRAASVLGVVDAGGIGFYIKQYIDFRFFPAVTASLLMILAVVLLLDALSSRLRTALIKRRS